jgi:hypothetical protein
MAGPWLAPLLSIGISAGSMALQYLFSPKVKQEPVDKGKLDDIRITSSDYGTFIPRGWGKIRIGGNLIWSSGVVHTIVESPTDGGKGVPQAPATRTHVYTTSIAVLVCRGTIQNYLRIWADADLVIGNGEFATGDFEAEDADLSGGASTDTDGAASGGAFVTNLGNGGEAEFDFTSIPDPTRPRSNDPDEFYFPYTRISFYYKCDVLRTAELDIVINAVPSSQTIGFPASDDWTTKTIHIAGFVDTLTFGNTSDDAPDLDLSSIEKYFLLEIIPTYKAPTYRVTGAVNANIAYPKDIDDPSEFYNFTATADGDGKTAIQTSVAAETIRYYKGTNTQTQDSAIVAWLDSRYGAGEGALRTSAHRNLAYTVFENRTLKQARVENFTFELDCGSADVNDVLEDLCADVNIDPGDCDFSATDDLTQAGFVEHTKSSRRALIEYLERYHLFRIAEIDGKIQTVLETAESLATIDADLLRAHNDSEAMPAFDAEVLIKEESLLPREVRFSVMNPLSEYKNESVPAQLFASLSSTESIEYAFPIIDPPSSARLQAEKFILKSHSEDKAIEFFGMPEMAIYSIGDTITVPIDGIDTKLRIEKKQMELPLGKIRFQGVSVSPFAPTVFQDDFTELSAQTTQQLATFNFPRNSVVIPIQSEPLTEKDKGKLGLYLAVCGRGRGASENISVLREFDDDNFIRQFAVDSPSVAGFCVAPLGDHADPLDEDTKGHLDIWFFDNIQLESVLQADIDRYPVLNLLRVGGEWIQFRTATVQTLEENSPYRSKWRVENLWRGRFGTDGVMTGHADNEYAVLYTSAVKFIELDKSDVGETITFKAVTGGQAEENGQVTSFTFSPGSAYTVSNGTELRTFDADSVTINELADVVATIIGDSNL